MLKALYDFKATYAKSLSFTANEYFILHQTNLKHKNWWQVINKNGEIGFIPSNYIEPISVTEGTYIKFLSRCIDYLEHNDVSSEYLISDKRDQIFRLKDLRRQFTSEYSGSTTATTTNSETDLVTTLTQKDSDESISSTEKFSKKSSKTPSLSSTSVITRDSVDLLEEPIKPIHKMGNSEDSIKKSFENIEEEYKRELPIARRCSLVKIETASNPVITHQSVFDLVEAVRIHTHLSHELSRIAVITVVQGLHELLPASVFPYLSTILSHSDKSLATANVQIDETYDASRLKIIFQELTACKQDSQQRSWMLHEDESVLSDYFKELISILV